MLLSSELIYLKGGWEQKRSYLRLSACADSRINFQAQQRVMDMREQLTESDIKKIREEIEYRKLVVRKEAIEAVKEARPREISAKILNIMRQRRIKTGMRAGSVIWRI